MLILHHLSLPHLTIVWWCLKIKLNLYLSKCLTKLFQLLQEAGFAPPLFATFDNGLVYQYIPGEVLTVETVCSSAVYPLIARKMAKLHKLRLHSSQSKPALWSKCENFINLISEQYSPIEKQKR